MGQGGWPGRACSHHFNLSIVPRGCLCGMKGLSLKMPSMACSEARYAQPSGITSDACVRRPCSFWVSSSVCTVVHSHSLMAIMYLSCFPCVNATVFWSRSHLKPMKTGFKEKLVSLDGSHGIPNWSEMWLMCSKEKAYASA